MHYIVSEEHTTNSSGFITMVMNPEGFVVCSSESQLWYQWIDDAMLEVCSEVLAWRLKTQHYTIWINL